MESMLNKLRSTVSSAASNAVSNAVSIASQVSNYLPGNPVTREYEATAHIASAGRGLMWKIYKGYKKTTKEEAAIFLFEKRQLEKWERQEREAMLERIRKGVSQLTRLRHPQILTVQHPLEESRETLAFATEPVFSSLANVLGQHDNLPSPLPPSLKDFKFYDVEIKYGLLQISEGLGFLHNSVKGVHRCICLENIVLNQQGAWKLFGFDFCVMNQASPDKEAFWPFEEYESTHHELSQPDLDFLSPEYALSHTLDTAADMFSFGVVIYAVYNKGKPLFQNHRDFVAFKRNASELKNPNRLSLDNVPSVLKDQVRLMLNSTPQLRPDALQFSKISYFDDIGVKTLSYLDQLFQWDNMQKSQFYKSLPQILPQLPRRVLLLRVIPCLNKECVNPTMIPFVLPVMLQVAEVCSKEEYVQHILPHLKPIMKITEPVQVMLLLMLKMELLLSKTPAEDICSDTLPLLYRALECNTQQIQELCLSVLPTCAPLVDGPTMKNALLPRIKRLCINSGYLSVRVNCLVCIGKVLEYLDKWLIVDDIFPFLTQVPSKESAVVMAMAGILKVALYHKKLGIPKEVLATKVLPFLFPLSIENSLTPAQHSTLMTLIRDMTDRVETEHKAKLEHLNSIRTEQKSLKLAMPSAVPPLDSSASSATSPNMNDWFGSSDNKSKTPTAGVGTPNGTIGHQTSPNGIVGGGGLSLEEKQRIANQQNVQSTFSNQAPVLPSPPQPSNPLKGATKSPPQNSTSNFISSNLNSLSLNKKVSHGSDAIMNSWGNTTQSSLSSSGISGGTPATTMQSPTWSHQQPQQPQQPFSASHSMNQFQVANSNQFQLSSGSMATPSSTFHSQQMGMGMYSPTGMQQSMSFQNQFNSPSNSFASTGLPMAPSMLSPQNRFPSSSASPLKPLSSSDINDFLS